MGNLSTTQVLQVVGSLQEIAGGLSDYVITNQMELTATEKAAIMDNQEKMIALANGLTDLASDLVFEDVVAQLTQLDAINEGIAKKLETLGSIQKVIKITADLVTLAIAISTFKPGDIASSAADILDQLGVKLG